MESHITTLYKFIDDDLENEGHKRERTIYEVLRTTNYPSTTYGNYINPPILSKGMWDELGYYLSQNERNNRTDIDPTLFYTIRMDGHNFSKKILPYLRSKGIISRGYSLEFEKAMKHAQMYVFKSVQNAICCFCQSDEITVLVGPSRINKDGKVCNIAHNGRFQKYNSLPSSGVASTFSLSLVTSLVETEKFDKVHLMTSVEFDSRIGQYDSFESAMQMILWRAYDCSVNGISSGIHLNEIPNKKSTDGFNSGQKLKFLDSLHILEHMTDHQLYGTFLWNEHVEKDFVSETNGKSYTRREMVTRTKSLQLLKVLKEFMVDFESLYDTSDMTDSTNVNESVPFKRNYLHHNYCLAQEFNELVA